MTELDVRIVKLEPMRVASVLGFGESPEPVAWQRLRTWAEPLSLLDDPEARIFGFNNPNPSPGSPNYGYELWLRVKPGFDPGGEVEIKEFSGGLYAVTRFKDLNNIGEVWQQLVLWREVSAYQPAHHQWLEELLSAPDLPPEEYVFDIYLPIRR